MTILNCPPHIQVDSHSLRESIELPANGKFSATIVGYGRYGRNYIGPKYALLHEHWCPEAVVDPFITPASFKQSVLGKAQPDVQPFQSFSTWFDGYFSQLDPKSQSNHVVEIALKPELISQEFAHYVAAGVRNFILPKPVAANQSQLNDMLVLIDQYQVKVAVASQWYYADLPQLIRREIERLGGQVDRVEVDFSKQNGLEYLTDPPLLELPHALQILESVGLVDFDHATPIVRGAKTWTEVTYQSPEIPGGVHIRADIDYQPKKSYENCQPDWDIQERSLKVFLTPHSVDAEIMVDFWIKFHPSGEFAVRPGQLRFLDDVKGVKSYLTIQFVEDQLLRMNRVIYPMFALDFETFQRQEKISTLHRYQSLGRQIMTIQTLWQRQTRTSE